MKCIVHLDMDCFYAQVEAVRLGINCRTEPYILSQWKNLIAVNYPARNCGIARLDSLAEAIKKCPHVKVSHVATYAMGEAEYKYHKNPQKGTHKVALEPYREASRKIFNILQSFDGVEVEKGSVDEAYLDVTLAAQKELDSIVAPNSQCQVSLENVLHPETNVIPNKQTEVNAWFQAQGKQFSDVFDAALHPQATVERRLLLCAASRVVWNMRQKIYQDLHYDCSAGIAHNKILAKSMSSRHKPNKQTLLFPDCVASAIWDAPYHNIWGFGGKLGEMVRRACGGVELCREAWLVPIDALRGALGNEDAEYVYRRLRFYGESTIRKRSISKTLAASKTFRPLTSSIDEVRKWVTVLCGELSVRYKEFCDLNKTKGHTLNVKLGNKGLSQPGGVLHKTLALPEAVTTDTLIATVMKCVAATFASQVVVTVNSVTLTIGSFKNCSGEENFGRGQQMMLTDFFASKNAKKRQREDCESVNEKSPSSHSSSGLIEEKGSGNNVTIID